jgi:hypothetical protein
LLHKTGHGSCTKAKKDVIQLAESAVGRLSKNGEPFEVEAEIIREIHVAVRGKLLERLLNLIPFVNIRTKASIHVKKGDKS